VITLSTYTTGTLFLVITLLNYQKLLISVAIQISKASSLVLRERRDLLLPLRERRDFLLPLRDRRERRERRDFLLALRDLLLFRDLLLPLRERRDFLLPLRERRRFRDVTTHCFSHALRTLAGTLRDRDLRTRRAIFINMADIILFA
jgi:hypothetical protein